MGRHLTLRAALVAAAALPFTPQLHAQHDYAAEPGLHRGSDTAAVTVIEFIDLGCPACAEFARETFPLIDADYIQTGRIRWTFVPITIGSFRHSKRASIAALCAARQDAFYAMHELLFAHQRRWQRTRNPRGRFRDLASDLGLDLARFDACYDSDETEDRAERLTRSSHRLPVPGTPAFLVGDRWVYGALSADAFRRVLDEQLQP